MELSACVEALRLVRGRTSPVDVAAFRKIIININTDSRYVVDKGRRLRVRAVHRAEINADYVARVLAEIVIDMLNKSD